MREKEEKNKNRVTDYVKTLGKPRARAYAIAFYEHCVGRRQVWPCYAHYCGVTVSEAELIRTQINECFLSPEAN